MTVAVTARRPVVAMVGGGQLARMTHQAAIALGIELRVLAPEDAAAVAAGARPFADVAALVDGADVVTFDHERVDPASVAAEGVPVAPAPEAKLHAQDKLHQRRSLAAHGLPVPPFAHATTVAEGRAFAAAHGWPLIAKTPRGGYDGRGVFPVAGEDELAALLGEVPDGLLLEPQLTLTGELAVLVARSATGECCAYPVCETVQRDAMCREIVVPAPVDPALAAEAQALAVQIAERIGAVGIVAVELFVTPDGLLVNELALRPHNSGHWTIEGAVTSQFEQHLRAILGWPLGDPSLTAPEVATVNVIGPADGSDPAARITGALSVRGAHVHLYGKEARPGRKLGHVTVLGSEPGDALARARTAAARLEGAA